MHINVNFLHSSWCISLPIVCYQAFYLNFFLLVCILQLLLAVGTKLEHVIIQLAHEVAEKHSAIQGELVVQPSDDSLDPFPKFFWDSLLFLDTGKHISLKLNLWHSLICFIFLFFFSFFLFIILMIITLQDRVFQVTFGFNSCMMGKLHYIIPRLVIG